MASVVDLNLNKQTIGIDLKKKNITLLIYSN